MRRLVIRFVKDQSGATAIEYGLIAAMVAVGIIVALTSFGGSLTSLFGSVQTRAGGAMDAATGG
ncbi:MAG: Flp family type IVb pilin [Hyphomicrobiales bacterium]|nr:MAG: Flp family type IVb pilin [Hyphomicrobiales bacterium]